MRFVPIVVRMPLEGHADAQRGELQREERGGGGPEESLHGHPATMASAPSDMQVGAPPELVRRGRLAHVGVRRSSGQPWWGDREEALRHLGQAVSAGFPYAVLLRLDPTFDAIRAGPEFGRLLAEVEAREREQRAASQDGSTPD